MFTLYQIAFRSVAKTIPDRRSVYIENVIFGAMFGTERCCSAPLLKVVRPVSDGFQDAAASKRSNRVYSVPDRFSQRPKNLSGIV